MERIEVDGVLMGWLKPHTKMVRVFRATFKPAARPVFYAVLPNGVTTEFTLPTRKQAIEWLIAANRDLTSIR